MVTLMQALPYSNWSILATSHATVLALATANLGPDGLERLVLDSPVDLASEKPFSYEIMQAAVIETLRHCTAAARCATRFPNLQQRFRTLLATVSAQPIKLTLDYLDSFDQQVSVAAVIDRWRLLEIAFQAAYWPDTIAQLPSNDRTN